MNATSDLVSVTLAAQPSRMACARSEPASKRPLLPMSNICLTPACQNGTIHACKPWKLSSQSSMPCTIRMRQVIAGSNEKHACFSMFCMHSIPCLTSHCTDREPRAPRPPLMIHLPGACSGVGRSLGTLTTTLPMCFAADSWRSASGASWMGKTTAGNGCIWPANHRTCIQIQPPETR